MRKPKANLEDLATSRHPSEIDDGAEVIFQKGTRLGGDDFPTK